MTEPLYEAPSLSDMLPSLIFGQNLPSIICSLLVDPQPGERILDMCAAPGIQWHVTPHLSNFKQLKDWKLDAVD